MSGAVFARNLRLFANQNLSREAIGQFAAREARAARDDLIRSGQAPSTYRTYVDGREGAPEESVRSVILYRFNLASEAAKFALAFCVRRSPVLDGAYRKAWFVAVNGEEYRDDLSDIPAGAEVMITNPLPYHRKIDIGAMTMRVPGTSEITEAARQATMRRFPGVYVGRTFVTLPGGYVLKGRGRARARADRNRGAAMTYPALVIKND